MLRNILIISSSGLVLYSKDFTATFQQPRLIGSLITAMIEFSTQSMDMPVSYIEMDKVAITVATSDLASCAIFHDVADGDKYGSLVASEILKVFLWSFENELEKDSTFRDLKAFEEFGSKLPEVFRGCIQSILDKYFASYARLGVRQAVLVTESGETYSTSPIDRLAVLASVEALQHVATDIMSLNGDLPLSISVDGGRTRMAALKIDQAMLIVTCSREAKLTKLSEVLLTCAELAEQVFHLQESFHHNVV